MQRLQMKPNDLFFDSKRSRAAKVGEAGKGRLFGAMQRATSANATDWCRIRCVRLHEWATAEFFTEEWRPAEALDNPPLHAMPHGTRQPTLHTSRLLRSSRRG